MIHTRRKCPLQNITLLDDKKIIEYHMTPNVGSAYYLHMCYRDSFSGLMTIWYFCGPRVGRHCLKKLCITHDSRSKVADFLSSFAFLKKQNFPGLLTTIPRIPWMFKLISISKIPIFPLSKQKHRSYILKKV